MNYVDPTGEAAETIIDIAGAIWSLKDFIINPSLINAAFLVWDVASVVVPFVPGSYVTKAGKYVVQAGSKTDDVVDALKVLNKAQKIDAIKNGAVVLPYKELKKLSKGTGLEAHHLIEKRFADTLGIKSNDILSIAIDKETHQKITNTMRDELPCNMGTCLILHILGVVQKSCAKEKRAKSGTSPNCTNYYINGEVLSSLPFVGKSGYGTNIPVETQYWNEYNFLGFEVSIPAPIKNHDMDAFKKAWGLEW